MTDNTAAGLVDQLAETWGSIETLARLLTAHEWATPTACPGWTVQDQVAHLIGTESALAGRPPPAEGASPPESTAPGVAEHVRNDIGRANEQWVVSYRHCDPQQLVEDFHRITTQRLESLRARPEAEWDEPSWTPAGPATYRRFMQIRVFDSWVHEQDIRRALHRPGHRDGPAAEQAIDEIQRSLGYVVGKKAGAPAGARLTIELTGPVQRSIHVAVDGRASVVDELDRPADATLRLTSDALVALACGRSNPDDETVGVQGDEVLGRQIATHLAFTI